MPARDGLERLHIAEGVLAELLLGAPDLSGQQVLAMIRNIVAVMERATEHATCRNCGKEITQLSDESRWLHTDRDRSRGCRAASFTEADGWDERLSQSAVAAPPVGWRPS